jgi:ABC-type phosphate transport system auxiliary subunit
MSSPDLPDLDQIAMQLVQLRHRAQDLARLLERAEERHYQFPSDHSQKTLDDMRAEDSALRAEIAQLEEQIRPLLRRPEEP